MTALPDALDAADLAVGDRFRLSLAGDTYTVTGHRTVRSSQTYRVVESLNDRTGLRADINLLWGSVEVYAP